MVKQYTDWERRKSKVAKDLPWLNRNWGWVSNVALACIFIWSFGAIYKLQWMPPAELKRRSIDPRFGEDKYLVLKRLEQREAALSDQAKERNPSSADGK